MQREKQYRVGSVIRYRANGGELRTVVVEEKERDVKNGYPGFDGHLLNQPDFGVWGYDDQIVEVVKF